MNLWDIAETLFNNLLTFWNILNRKITILNNEISILTLIISGFSVIGISIWVLRKVF